MTLDEFYEALEKRVQEGAVFALDEFGKIRDAACNCPIETVAYGTLDARQRSTHVSTTSRQLGLEPTVFVLIVRAADFVPGPMLNLAGRDVRRRLLQICKLQESA